LTILLAGVFSALAQPLYRKLSSLFRGRQTPAAVCTLLLILLLIIGPLLTFFSILVAQAVQIADSAGPWIEKQVNEPDNLTRLIERFPELERLEAHRDQIVTKLGQAAGTVGSFLVNGLSATTKGTVTFFFHFFLLLYTMFFFLKDGRSILDKVLSYIPLAGRDKERLAEKFVSVSRATLKGTLIIGVVQGGLAGIGFAVAGIDGAVFWGTVMTVLSIIPAVGSALVWVPAVVYLIVTGHTMAGVVLGVYCALIVGSVDNILRPLLVGKDVRMHELLILFGTLGGIVLFGVVGFIIGPVIAALFTTIWEIYGTAFREVLSKE
jgi:predicted PurR-regulated permease PerM